MTSSLFPADSSRVELDTGGQILPEVRLVESSGDTVTLSLALADIALAVGSPVTLRWPAGPRGRHSRRGTVQRIDENRIDLRMVGEVEIEQLRNYVRGGGGESVLLVRPGEPEAIGYVHDISEHSVRAHFTGVELRPGQEMRLRIQLSDEIVEFPAIALRVSSIRQQVPVRGPLMVEMVAIFDQDERQAKVIRRYVLQLQLAARREAAAAQRLADEVFAEAVEAR
ncbi:PilZ domain-containing protein [Actinoplanes utahensis]|uniref:PilZ domain-containing protein n=1 Tax=Actinoplanes utahensis TaxID=1869 RepID=UPI000689F08B|nr:PilZ domain-containing protein [Actinoplanes utahensis]GIF28012.1 hypothetical protein Aut01nite_09980 [Actinoplanes utahensis]